MIKKITAAAATLALSVGIISTASAAELTQPSSPIQEPIQVNYSNIITPFAASIYVTRYEYFDKADFPQSYMTPATLSVTQYFNNNKYGGNIPKIKADPYGNDFWKVTYAGHISKFME